MRAYLKDKETDQLIQMEISRNPQGQLISPHGDPINGFTSETVMLKGWPDTLCDVMVSYYGDEWLIPVKSRARERQEKPTFEEMAKMTINELEALPEMPDETPRFHAVFYGTTCGHKHLDEEAARKCGERTWPKYGGTVWQV